MTPPSRSIAAVLILAGIGIAALPHPWHLLPVGVDLVVILYLLGELLHARRGHRSIWYTGPMAEHRLITPDQRGRISLARLKHPVASHYLVTREDDGTIILRPAVITTVEDDRG